MKLLSFLGLGKSAPDEEFDVVALNADEIAEQLAEARKEVDSMKAEHSAQLGAKDQKIEDLEAAAETTAAELAAKDTEIAQLKADAKEVDELAEAKAAVILQQAGHPPVEVPADPVEPTGELSDDEIREKFAAMPAGPERSKFYQENRDVIAS